MNTAEILYNLRKEHNLSQKELAERAGVSQSTIAKIEISRNEATGSTLRKLANFFDVSADYLLGLEDDFGIKKSAGASAPTFTREEMDLVFKFRELPEQLKAIVKQQLDVFSTPETLFENTEKSH